MSISRNDHCHEAWRNLGERIISLLTILSGVTAFLNVFTPSKYASINNVHLPLLSLIIATYYVAIFIASIYVIESLLNYYSSICTGQPLEHMKLIRMSVGAIGSITISLALAFSYEYLMLLIDLLRSLISALHQSLTIDMFMLIIKRIITISPIITLLIDIATLLKLTLIAYNVTQPVSSLCDLLLYDSNLNRGRNLRNRLIDYLPKPGLDFIKLILKC